MANELTFDGLLRALFTVRQVRSGFAELEAEIVREIAHEVRDSGLAAKGEIDGVGGYEVHKGQAKPGRWNHPALARVVVYKHLEETGEFDPDALVTALLAAAGIQYWKTTELKRIGITTADEFYEWIPAKPSVQFTAAGS
jgi:hypothetical protein